MATTVSRLRTHASIPLYRNAYALMLSAGASSGLGVLYWLLASRLYPPEVVGTSSSAVAALLFLTGLASFYLDGSLLRFLPRAGTAAPRLVLGSYAVSLTLAAVLAAVFLAGIDVWAPRLGFLASSPEWVAAAIAATVLSVLFSMQDGVLTGIRRTLWVPLENVVYAIAKIVLLIVVAGTLQDTGILVAWVVPVIFIIPVINALLLRFVPRHAEATRDDEERVTLGIVARYAVGNYVGFLFTLAYLRLPPLLVLNEAGSEASAFFYPPWMVATTLSLLAVNFSMSLIVEATVDRARLALHLRRSATQMARLFGPAVVLLVVLAPLVLLPFGERYAEEGSTLLRLVALAAIPNAVCVLAFGAARVRDRVRVIVAAQAAGAISALGLSWLLLPGLGIEGVGIAWLASRTALAGVLFATELRPLLGGGPDAATRRSAPGTGGMVTPGPAEPATVADERKDDEASA